MIVEEKRIDQAWSAQGLGMLRRYLPDNYRLHVWTDRVAVPRATKIHTHPWDFTSYVLYGAINNVYYLETAGDPTHYRYKIKCGVGCQVIGEPESVHLYAHSECIYYPGDTYAHRFNDLHESQALNGTITLIKRSKPQPINNRADYDPDHAFVYAPFDDKQGKHSREFISAEPRPATKAESEYGEQSLLMMLHTLRRLLQDSKK